MGTSRETSFSLATGSSYQRIKADKKSYNYEYAVICLMVLITLSSIVWSISISIMPMELRKAFLDVKLSFQARDFNYMNTEQKELLHKDLEVLINRTYTVEKEETENDASRLKTEKHTMTEEDMVAITAQKSTKRPKVHKISHVFQTVADLHRTQDNSEIKNIEEDDNETESEKTEFNATQDRLFLEKMTYTIISSQSDNTMSMIESVPFLSEIVAIVWTAMFLIFQSSIQQWSVVPNPWRIVIPAIVMCSSMTFVCLIYVISSHNELEGFCHQLRGNLTDPNAISCGEAFTVLRPVIIHNKYSADSCLQLFRTSLLFTFLLWCIALAIMLLRYFYALDFQVADYHRSSSDGKVLRLTEYTEVPLDLPNSKVIHEKHIAEGEFSSAKSHLSEVEPSLP